MADKGTVDTEGLLSARVVWDSSAHAPDAAASQLGRMSLDGAGHSGRSPIRDGGVSEQQAQPAAADENAHPPSEDEWTYRDPKGRIQVNETSPNVVPLRTNALMLCTAAACADAAYNLSFVKSPFSFRALYHVVAVQGPFPRSDIITWFEDGFFPAELPIRSAEAAKDAPFRPLSQLMRVWTGAAGGPPPGFDTKPEPQLPATADAPAAEPETAQPQASQPPADIDFSAAQVISYYGLPV